jgi:type II secretory pathway pseudopilin PulG
MPKTSCRVGDDAGFTLIELLVVITMTPLGWN